MIIRILNWCFGCRHNRTTWPMTDRRRRDTYIVCLDCGKEFEYNLLKGSK